MPPPSPRAAGGHHPRNQGPAAPPAYHRNVPTRDRRLRERLAARLAGAPDVAHVLAVADEVVRSVVPAQGAAWGTVDPASGLSTSCHVFGRLSEGSAGVPGGGTGRERRLFELDWAEDGPATFAGLVREGRTAAGLRLEVGDPRGVRRYHELLGPAGVHDELRLSLTIDGEPWATGVLYRWSGSSTPDPFTRDDVALAAAAAPLVASAVRAGLLRAVCDHPAVDVPPGSLVLDAHGRVVVSSPPRRTCSPAWTPTASSPPPCPPSKPAPARGAAPR